MNITNNMWNSVKAPVAPAIRMSQKRELLCSDISATFIVTFFVRWRCCHLDGQKASINLTLIKKAGLSRPAEALNRKLGNAFVIGKTMQPL